MSQLSSSPWTKDRWEKLLSLSSHGSSGCSSLRGCISTKVALLWLFSPLRMLPSLPTTPHYVSCHPNSEEKINGKRKQNICPPQKLFSPLKSNLGQVQATQQREIMWRTISLYFASLVLKMIWNQKKTGEEKIGNAVNPSQVGGRGGFEGGRGVHATCLMTSYCLHPLQPHHISYKSIKSSISTAPKIC